MAAEVGVLLDVLIILVVAKIGGEAAERLRQPPVLGEILFGVAMGYHLLGGPLGLPDLNAASDALGHDGTILVFLAELGAILLLFEVGLESDLKSLRKVGGSSLVVAFIGIVASFAAGYGASMGMSVVWPAWAAAQESLPPYLLHTFVGAALTATSVGITARVLGDMRRLRSPEARIILGAAVIDDVAGLLILAVVTALVAAAAGTGALDVLAVGQLAGIAIGFLVVSLLVGLWVVPRAYDALVDRARVRGVSVTLAVAFALGMAYAAYLVQLHPIVGAFAAGLLLAPTRHAHDLRHELTPVGALFIGFFFVTLGMRIDLSQMEGNTLIVVVGGLALSAIAIAAKLACGFGVLRGQASRWIVGVGMAPRGEVGLIFAALGLSSGLLAPWQYTAVVLVAVVTTFVTPIWLRQLRGSFTGPEDAPARLPREVGDMP